MAEAWAVTAWVVGARGMARVSVTFPTEPDVNEGHGIRREATALYRRTYHDWPEGSPEHSVTKLESVPSVPPRAARTEET